MRKLHLEKCVDPHFQRQLVFADIQCSGNARCSSIALTLHLYGLLWKRPKQQTAEPHHRAMLSVRIQHILLCIVMLQYARLLPQRLVDIAPPLCVAPHLDNDKTDH